MKAVYYAFTMILSLMLSSCNNDESLDKNNYSPSALIFKATSITNSQNSAISKASQSMGTDTILLFSGKDIAWFNESTGELKFNDGFSEIEEVKNYYTSANLNVYSGDQFLYSFNFILTSDVMSWSINSPVIYKGIAENTYYIKNGYPDRNLTDLDKDNPWRIEREKNWNTLVQSEGWKQFILQLKKEGRHRE